MTSSRLMLPGAAEIAGERGRTETGREILTARGQERVCLKKTDLRGVAASKSLGVAAPAGPI